MKVYRWIFTVLLVIHIPVYSQPVGTTSLQFLKIMPTARALAMGGAYVSLADGSDAVFWNPAGLTTLETFELGISHIRYLVDTDLTSFSAALSIGDIGTIALFGTYMRYGDISETKEDLLGFNADGTYNPGLTGRMIRPVSMVTGFSYAKRLTDRFSIGLTVKFIREDLVRAAVNMWSLDPGILYNTGYRSIKLGVSIRNFGPEVKFVEDSYPMPQELDLGISAYLLSPGESLLFYSKSQRLLVSGCIQHPRDYNQQFNIGMEYSYNKTIFIRTGYKFNYDTENISYGFGLQISKFTLDYAYSEFGEYFTGVQRVSFTIRI